MTLPSDVALCCADVAKMSPGASSLAHTCVWKTEPRNGKPRRIPSTFWPPGIHVLSSQEHQFPIDKLGHPASMMEARAERLDYSEEEENHISVACGQAQPASRAAWLSCNITLTRAHSSKRWSYLGHLHRALHHTG